MIVKLVRYRVRRPDIDVVEDAIRDFISAIAEQEPQTTYAIYRANNGVSYVHIMTFADATAEERHRDAAYTRAFIDALYPRCDAGPTFTDLSLLAAAGV